MTSCSCLVHLSTCEAKALSQTHSAPRLWPVRPPSTLCSSVPAPSSNLKYALGGGTLCRRGFTGPPRAPVCLAAPRARRCGCGAQAASAAASARARACERASARGERERDPCSSPARARGSERPRGRWVGWGGVGEGLRRCAAPRVYTTKAAADARPTPPNAKLPLPSPQLRARLPRGSDSGRTTVCETDSTAQTDPAAARTSGAGRVPDSRKAELQKIAAPQATGRRPRRRSQPRPRRPRAPCHRHTAAAGEAPNPKIEVPKAVTDIDKARAAAAAARPLGVWR